MRWRRYTGSVGAALRASAWWVTIAPFCVATDLPVLATSAYRPIQLGSEPDNYPITELLGRLLSFRGRVRLARSLILFVRALILCALVLLAAKVVEVVTRHPMSGWLPVGLFLVAGWALHVALHHPISPFEVARLVDRRMLLNEQVATAVETTLGNRLERSLYRTQVRLATNRLRDVEPSLAVPLVIPRRDLRLLVGIALIYVGVGYVGTLGINFPRAILPVEAELAKQAQSQAQAPSPYVTVDPSAAQLGMQNQPLLDKPIASNQTSSDLNALKQQLQAQQISPEQYQTQLRQVQQRLESQASDSLAAQQALAALASSLKDVSATQSISDSLNGGDYNKASQQLSDLGKQADQLSPDARTELADRMAQAAAQTQQTNSTISNDAGQVASALRQNDSQAVSKSLDQLGQAVQQASQSISTQSQLGQQLQDVRQQLGDNSSNPASNGSQPNASANDPSGATNPSAAANPPGDIPPTGTNQSQSAQGPGNRSDPNAPGDPSAAANQYSAAGQIASRSSTQQIQNDQGGNGGGVGTSPGANPLSGSPSPLDAHGVRLTIVGKASGPGANSTTPGDRSAPLTSAGDTGLSGLPSSGTLPSNVPITVHQESNQVPLDRKPVVREYFTNAGQ